MAMDIASVLERWANETHDFALVVLFPEARVMWANDALASVLGYAPGELVGKSLRMIFTPEDLQRGLDQHELDVAREVGRAEDDRWHLCKDGSRVFCNGILTCLKGAEGGVAGFMKVFRDRTDVRTQNSRDARVQAVGSRAPGEPQGHIPQHARPRAAYPDQCDHQCRCSGPASARSRSQGQSDRDRRAPECDGGTTDRRLAGRDANRRGPPQAEYRSPKPPKSDHFRDGAAIDSHPGKGPSLFESSCPKCPLSSKRIRSD